MATTSDWCYGGRHKECQVDFFYRDIKLFTCDCLCHENIMYPIGTKLPCDKSVVELAKETCYFMYYKNKNLYYKTSSGFVVVIPIEECHENLAFKHEERTMFFLKWLRPQYTSAFQALNQKDERKPIALLSANNSAEHLDNSPDGFRHMHSIFD